MSTTLTPTDQPLHYAEARAGTIVHTGTLPIGAVRITPLAVESATDENALLGALATAGVSAPPLPDVGAELEQGDIYDYSGTLYMVRQSHTRTEHDPATVPALFTSYQEGMGVLPWIVGEQVYVGTQRTFGGSTYVCLQAHQTQSDQEPDAVGIIGVLWGVVNLTSEWVSGEQGIQIGDLRTYEGVTYRCIQNPGINIWPPPTVPALWVAV